MRFMCRIASVLAFALIVLPLSSAAANDHAAPARQDAVAVLTVMGGSVTLAPQGEAPQEITGDNEAVVEVREGDRITTAEASEAVLTFFEGIEVWLAPGTSLDVTKLAVEGEAVQVGMDMIIGETVSTVARALDANEQFAIDTQAASISVRGTQFAVFIRESGVTQVASLDGEVEVAAQGETVTVPAGYGVRVDPGSPPGEVNVWGQARINVITPDEDVENLPVALTNVDNEQVYYYHTDELFTVLKGTYTGIVYSPGPYRIAELSFPEDIAAQQPIEVGVALGAITIDVENGGAAEELEPEQFTVTLQQDDLEAQVKVKSGQTFLVGPGEWLLKIAREAEPDVTTAVPVTVEAGQVVSVPWSPGASG